MEKSPVRSDPMLIFMSGNRPLNLTLFGSYPHCMIFGMCIDYRSAESIGIRIVLYFKRTLELLISTLILMFCCPLGLGKKLET